MSINIDSNELLLELLDVYRSERDMNRSERDRLEAALKTEVEKNSVKQWYENGDAMRVGALAKMCRVSSTVTMWSEVKRAIASGVISQNDVHEQRFMTFTSRIRVERFINRNVVFIFTQKAREERAKRRKVNKMKFSY